MKKYPVSPTETNPTKMGTDLVTARQIQECTISHTVASGETVD